MAQVKIPTPDTSATCHSTQVEQYKKGKHALAWAAMKAMPTIHRQPMAMIEGENGCGGCHTIGLKTPKSRNGVLPYMSFGWRCKSTLFI